MSVFTPFRNKNVVRTWVAVGGAMKLAHALNTPATWPEFRSMDLSPAAYAQQAQRVNVDQIAGSSVTFMPFRCDGSTSILSTVIPATTSTQVEVVQGSTGRIHVCGWSFTSSAVPISMTWVQGSSADACVTNETNKAGKYVFSSFSGISSPNTGYPQFITSSAASLCLNVTSTGDGGGVLTYIVST